MSKERAKAAVVALIAAATCVQLFGVTFISLPPAATPPGTRAVSEAVLWSYFEEEWKLFAPNPISIDRDLFVQGAWRDADGTVTTGEWVDLTAIDNAIVAHSVGAPRSAYLTARMAGSLDTVWAGVGARIRSEIADATLVDEPLTVADLRDVLTEHEVPAPQIDAASDFDAAAVTFTTDVLRSLEPDLTLVAVRYATRMTSVPLWESRHTVTAVPGAEVPGPWRTPSADDTERRAAVARFLGRHS